MTPVARVAEPIVLSKNAAKWTAKHLDKVAKNPTKRPPSAQYAHPEVVAALEGMSGHKCFYCEQSTKQTKKTVDHHIDAVEEPALAFAWSNLYLACYDCNIGKPPHRSIPVHDCVDPCDPAAAPHEHLTFDGELVRARGDSPRGHTTIQKYRLDRPELDLARARLLIRFHEVIHDIEVAMRTDRRTALTDHEKERLLAFRQRDQPFSLMFAVYLAKVGPSLGL